MDDELRVDAAVVLRVLATPSRIRFRHDADLKSDETLDEIVFIPGCLLFSPD
jgi:hypothetical protein